MITEKALIARINRKLALDEERLYKTPASVVHEFGEYHIIRFGGVVSRNVVATHLDLELLASELGVLRESERVAL